MVHNDIRADIRAGTATPSVLTRLNTVWHRRALAVFMVIVLGHFAEHIAQLFQIYVLGWPVAKARGVLGLPFPWLVTSEVMHYGYAVLMLIGLIILRRGFAGRAKTWWTVALVVQVWHHFEHLLLQIQAITGHYFFGRSAPTSLLQLFVSRAELHMFYNTVVLVPMLFAMVWHRMPLPSELALARCGCAPASRKVATA